MYEYQKSERADCELLSMHVNRPSLLHLMHEPRRPPCI